MATSQEQAPNTLRCSARKATSVSGHLQMPKRLREAKDVLNRVLGPCHAPIPIVCLQFAINCRTWECMWACIPGSLAVWSDY